MGRIRTKFIKKNTKRIMDAYPDSFTDDFEKNKEFLKNNENLDIYGKKLRNKIAGYATKLMKDKKKANGPEMKIQEKKLEKTASK